MSLHCALIVAEIERLADGDGPAALSLSLGNHSLMRSHLLTKILKLRVDRPGKKHEKHVVVFGPSTWLLFSSSLGSHLSHDLHLYHSLSLCSSSSSSQCPFTVR